MNLRIKLIVLFLVISLIPLGAVLYVSNNGMQELQTYSEDQSAQSLRTQMENQLENEVGARQEEIQNLINAREVDAKTLSNLGAINNYMAANNGEMETIQTLSQDQLGYIALEMRNSIKNTAQSIARYKYDSTIDELTPEQKENLKDDVEELIAGTSGNFTETQGTMYESFQPGYIGNTGYSFIIDTNGDTEIHFSIEDTKNVIDDVGLTVFNEVTEKAPNYDSGQSYGIAEYMFPDTTQEGNPEELKFIAYTYYEPLDWVIAPSVYYYELQEIAVQDSQEQVERTFTNYLNDKIISVGDQQKEAYHKIVFTDTQGKEIASAIEGEVTTDSSSDYSEEPWFKIAKSNDKDSVYFGEIYSVEGEERQKISKPVYYDEEFVGVISMTFRYSLLTEITNKVELGEKGYLYISNQDGVLVSHPDPELVNSLDISAGDAGEELADISTNKMLQGETGIDEYTEYVTDEDGATKWVAYAPLSVGDKQFSIAATLPVEEANAPAVQLGNDLQTKADSSRNFMLLITGIAAILIGIAGYFASKYISDPIVSIKEKAEKLAVGKFDITIEENNRGDEIGDMVRSFSTMQDNFQRHVDQTKKSLNDLSSGQLDTEVDTTGMEGEYREIGETINESLTSVRTSLGKISDIMHRLSKGELDTLDTNEMEGEYREMGESVNQSIESIDNSLNEVSEALDNISKGNLDTNIDESGLEGEYRRMAESVNESIESVRRSLTQVSDAINDIEHGELDSRVETGGMSGEYREMGEAINGSIKAINVSLTQVSNALNDISQGNLESKVDETEMEGEYREMGESVNQSIESIKNSLEKISVVMNNLAVGELDTGIDTTSMKGEYKEIGESINASVESINKALNQISTASEGLKDGKLDQEISTEELSGDYKDIMEDLNVAMKQLNGSIREVQAAVQEISDASESIASSSQELNSTSSEVSDSVQAISEGAAQQSEMTRELSGNIEDASANSEESAAESEDIAATAEEVASETQEARNEGQKAAEQINKAQELLKETTDKAKQLDQQSEQIGKIVDTISQIAEQTNLLALNASVEASRAGEEGQGFAVVAEEVKDLAEETQDETENIRETIEKTQENTTKVVNSIQEVDQAVDETGKIVNSNAESFDQINDSISSVTESVQEISNAIDSLSKGMQEAASNVDEVEGIAEESESKSESAAAAAEEQAASVEELSSSAEELAALGDELQEKVENYETSERSSGNE